VCSIRLFVLVCAGPGFFHHGDNQRPESRSAERSSVPEELKTMRIHTKLLPTIEYNGKWHRAELYEDVGFSRACTFKCMQIKHRFVNQGMAKSLGSWSYRCSIKRRRCQNLLFLVSSSEYMAIQHAQITFLCLA
jgi:hypothetical protein